MMLGIFLLFFLEVVGMIRKLKYPRIGGFGAKINVSLADGFAFLDHLSWDAFHEGNQLKQYLHQYLKTLGHYPAEVLADKLYCTRENRTTLKQMGIKLLAKP